MTAPFEPELLNDHAPAFGLLVRLEMHRRCKCGNEMATIGHGRGPYAAELVCSRCGAHRGWLSHSTANWIGTVVSKFGAPTTPIILRRR